MIIPSAAPQRNDTTKFQMAGHTAPEPCINALLETDKVSGAKIMIFCNLFGIAAIIHHTDQTSGGSSYQDNSSVHRANLSG